MPFYEYECSACKYYTEVLQKISDPVLKKCPSCGKSTLKRLVSAPVFRLKGSGWYETDFKSESEQKRNLVGEAEKESKEDKPKDSKEGGESKPADTATKTEAASSESKPASASKPAKSRAKPAAKSKAKAAPKKKPKRR